MLFYNVDEQLNEKGQSKSFFSILQTLHKRDGI